jgi:hypothetical protein
MRLRPWLAKLSFAALAIAVLIGLAASLGTRLGFWDYRFGLFVLFPWCLIAGAVALVFGLVWVLWAVIANRGEAARYGVIGALGAIALLAMPLYDISLAVTSPQIHDISTDIEHPPPFVALLPLRQADARDGRDITPANYDGAQPARGPDGEIEATAALQKKYYPDIHPRADLTSPEKFFDRALKTAYRMGWHVVAVVPQEGRIEATDTSLWFGLTDDVAIRVKPAGQGVRLDIRSKSRDDMSGTPFGPTDMGANAASIRSFLKTLSDTY